MIVIKLLLCLQDTLFSFVVTWWCFNGTKWLLYFSFLFFTIFSPKDSYEVKSTSVADWSKALVQYSKIWINLIRQPAVLRCPLTAIFMNPDSGDPDDLKKNRDRTIFSSE
uniref:Uncharacterized protein n=1 Tax=Cacopsylla melanoneura TaxID=428564 RepID=A0A8D8YR41_9HEMI